MVTKNAGMIEITEAELQKILLYMRVSRSGLTFEETAAIYNGLLGKINSRNGKNVEDDQHDKQNPV